MKITKYHVSFRVTPTFEYDIDKEYLLADTEHWLQHLSEKNWFTQTMKKDLLAFIQSQK